MKACCNCKKTSTLFTIAERIILLPTETRLLLKQNGYKDAVDCVHANSIKDFICDDCWRYLYLKQA